MTHHSFAIGDLVEIVDPTHEHYEETFYVRAATQKFLLLAHPGGSQTFNIRASQVEAAPITVALTPYIPLRQRLVNLCFLLAIANCFGCLVALVVVMTGQDYSRAGVGYLIGAALPLSFTSAVHLSEVK